MHLKTKTISGNDYWYVIESYRHRGKVRHRTLAYLGAAFNPFEGLEQERTTLAFALEIYLARFAGLSAEMLRKRTFYKAKKKPHPLPPRFKRAQITAEKVMYLVSNTPELSRISLDDKAADNLSRGLALRDYNPRV
jgi:hypothetical protein